MKPRRISWKKVQPLAASFFGFLVIAANAEQRFTEMPASYQEVSSGDDVQLRCKVQDKRGQCIWQKDRKPVGMHPDKYEWASNRGSDCTLLVRRASLDFDDGFWECQVTSGDFMRQDALTSLPARLLVRVKPRMPRLEYGGTILNSALTLREGQEVTISCVSRYGNPPALIKWFLGDEEIEPLREQTNVTEVDSPKTWAAHSLLRIRGRRENHGLTIRCVTIHPSSSLAATAESQLNIHYSPEVKLETSPRLLTTALEDSVSFLNLRCLADGNPTAAVKWFKDAAPLNAAALNIVSVTQNRSQSNNNTITVSELRFEPIKREDAGLYSCKAVNVMGESSPANYAFDVQYGPRPKAVGINGTLKEIEETVLLGSNVDNFECPDFEANPVAQYKWVHIRGGNSEITESPPRSRETGKRLRLENIMWSDEGDYRCVAFNVINGVTRKSVSEVRYILHVIGPPEIQVRPSSGEHGVHESIGWAGESVHRLKSRFCSRPPPRLVAWQWGSSHIRAGESIQPKYEALPLEPIIEDKVVTNCYWAKLEIKNLQKEDARMYTLLIESEKGQDSTNLKLTVRDPTEMRIIAAAASIGLLFLLLLISISIYSLLRIKQRRYERKEEKEEVGSIAADAVYSNFSNSGDYQKISKPSQSKSSGRKTNQDNNLAVIYDYDQITKQTQIMSPEALKVRRAPAVLQPPTIV